MRVPSGRVRTAENPGQSAGMDGAIRSRVPARRSPSTDSTLTRYIHPAAPVYQVQPPRPTCGGVEYTSAATT